MRILKLPPITVVSKAKDDPYYEFYLWVVDKCEKKYDKEKYQINQSAVYLNKENQQTMADQCEKWYWKHYDKKFMGKKYFHKSFMMTWLQYSPAINDSIDNGLMYVDLKKLIVKRRKV